jgi:quercetin dioxygenase-like cupin family protein
VKLQVLEYELTGAQSVQLDAAHRVIYRIAEEEAEYSTGAITLTGPAHVLSFELVTVPSPDAKLTADVDTEPGDGDRLIRLDRVSFPPGGVAYLHVHKGPGIRVLLEGEIRIDTDGTSHRYGPLEAWFEAGPVPVFAAASEAVPTSFVRCMVLPADLQGRRSITYVRDEDADKPKLQQYRVFVDAPLILSSVST